MVKKQNPDQGGNENRSQSFLLLNLRCDSSLVQEQQKRNQSKVLMIFEFKKKIKSKSEKEKD